MNKTLDLNLMLCIARKHVHKSNYAPTTTTKLTDICFS
jgi:hypothetical protein